MIFDSEESYRRAQKQAVNQLRDLFASGSALSSTVKPVPDYTSDLRLCLTAVAFVGNHFANDSKLNSLIESLRALEPWQYFYPPESLHITIQNVQTIDEPPKFDERTIQLARLIFERIIPEHKTLEFETDGLLVTPSSSALVAFADSSILALSKSLRNALAESQIPDDKHYISDEVVFGNITFCRFTRNPGSKFRELLDAYIGSEICIRANEIHLVSTNSVCYRPLTSIHGRFRLMD